MRRVRRLEIGSLGYGSAQMEYAKSMSTRLAVGPLIPSQGVCTWRSVGANARCRVLRTAASRTISCRSAWSTSPSPTAPIRSTTAYSLGTPGAPALPVAALLLGRQPEGSRAVRRSRLPGPAAGKGPSSASTSTSTCGESSSPRRCASCSPASSRPRDGTLARPKAHPLTGFSGANDSKYVRAAATAAGPVARSTSPTSSLSLYEQWNGGQVPDFVLVPLDTPTRRTVVSSFSIRPTPEAPT